MAKPIWPWQFDICVGNLNNLAPEQAVACFAFAQGCMSRAELSPELTHAWHAIAGMADLIAGADDLRKFGR